MPEKILALLSLKNTGIFMVGMMASKGWIENNWNDLVKAAILIMGVAFAIQSTLKEHTIAIENISETQEHIVEQQADTALVTNKIIRNLDLMQYRLEQAEGDIKINEEDIESILRGAIDGD